MSSNVKNYFSPPSSASTDNVLNITGTVYFGSGNAITGAMAFASGSLSMADDLSIVLGTTVATAATKVTLEYDKTTTGIGQFNIGSIAAPQVLNTNPGATVVASTINILHSAGAGDCGDLIGFYNKVAVSGAGDSGLTVVADAPRAYVLAGVAQEVYGSQPWAKHCGTGTITAMSSLSAKLLINDAEAFTATNSLNAGHFHVSTVSGAANGTITSSNFDGVMVEVYPNVTGLRSMLHLANESSAGVVNGVALAGLATTGINLSGATLTNEMVLSTGTTVTASGDTITFTRGVKTYVITMV